ncbi:uncharacterized protein PgNI_05069 [Pyricularia grisea]|uniref:Trichothecene 3-O-acetyltransferase-like N-terminal domain-containing protein n=1 Tax=Pyricularia grisea TaxID=148305 RepID=A0A6P8B9Y7_PYRGI|nr:uncharacterized protein PgNI_05069 [Pyricularia grisea]TLD12630.1 hypothetical protein PgNI_05069 [Pyricularia grisea]
MSTQAKFYQEHSIKVILPTPYQATTNLCYLNPVQIWPLNNRDARLFIDRLYQILNTLAHERPETSGTIRISHVQHQKHNVALVINPNDCITMDVQYAENEMHTFAQLKAARFPPSAFVGSRFKFDCAKTDDNYEVPAMRVLAVIINGGLILSWHFHHSLFDAEGMRVVFSIVGSIAAGNEPFYRSHHPKSLAMDFAARPGAAENTIFSEYNHPGTAKASCVGDPLHRVPLGSAIFQFRKDDLQQLQELLRKAAGGGDNSYPQAWMTLAVLTWVHISKARNRAEQKKLPHATPEAAAQLAMPINWKKRAPFGGQSRDYFGNANLTTTTAYPAGVKLDDDPATLLKLVNAVQHTLSQVDEAAVSAQYQLFASQVDRQAIKTALDRSNRNLLLFDSTWRIHGGADMALGAGLVPGLLGDGRPAAVRQAAAGCTVGGRALLLPGRIDSPVYELMVMLPTASLMTLCRDGNWMRWVDRVLW